MEKENENENERRAGVGTERWPAWMGFLLSSKFGFSFENSVQPWVYCSVHFLFVRGRVCSLIILRQSSVCEVSLTSCSPFFFDGNESSQELARRQHVGVVRGGHEEDEAGRGTGGSAPERVVLL
jgi:hypothetical protein